jgi:hypothetical protein
MRSLSGKHRVVAGVILVLMLGLVLMTFSASAGAKTKARPFHGTMHGTVSYIPGNPEPPYLYTVSNAVGDLSHMGASVLYAKHAAAMNFGGDMKLTAANGDTILIAYHGGGNLPPSIGDWYDLWMVATITGGTGRFAHVSGDIDMAASLRYMGLDVMVWPVIFNFSGTIRY